MDVDQARKVRRRIAALCHSGLDSASLSREAERLLRRVIPFDRACWHNVDPATAMITSVHGESAPADPLLPLLEYGSRDVNQYAGLARDPNSIGILSQATQGDCAQSRRYREVLEPMGIADELTASFLVDSTFWACARLYRRRGRPDFDSVDAAFMGAIAPTLAEGYRNALLVGALTARRDTEGPGLIVFDENDHIDEISAAATHWLRDIVDVDSTQLPHPIYAVAARARAIHEGSIGESVAPARARVPTRSGGWVVLHALRLMGTREGRIGIIIEPAPAPEVAHLVVSAYGLSPRERDVIHQMIRGQATKQIAATLGLSPYTVADHLRAIFAKVGVRSRGELVARVFFDHYYSRLDGEASDPR
jgi:DNA-binding CsgD family transcriptional regulator